MDGKRVALRSAKRRRSRSEGVHSGSLISTVRLLFHRRLFFPHLKAFAEAGHFPCPVFDLQKDERFPTIKLL